MEKPLGKDGSSGECEAELQALLEDYGYCFVFGLLVASQAAQKLCRHMGLGIASLSTGHLYK